MSVSEDLKILLLKEKMTITELAALASQKSGKSYTVFGISQKLARSSMKYEKSSVTVLISKKLKNKLIHI